MAALVLAKVAAAANMAVRFSKRINDSLLV